MNFSKHWKLFPAFFQSLEKPFPRAARSARVRGFTLIELIVVMTIIAAVAGALAPALRSAHASAQQARCSSNLRQFHAANTMYASDVGSYVPAASDIYGAQRMRWHGARTSPASPFEPEKGPLAPYLGYSKELRYCPSLKQAAADGFEKGCGGYGYNQYGVGSRSYISGSFRGAGAGMEVERINRPAETVMFCDTAFARNQRGEISLIEYSFAEPYRHLDENRPQETYVATPSIHFRHKGRANVIWCDGHVSAERMTFSSGKAYENQNIGWFGERNNELFDPF